MISVGIIGGSGFTGAELLRLCAGHPQFEVEFATADTQAGLRVGELYPSLAGAYPDLVFVPYEPGLAAQADLVFLGLPHGASQAMVPELLGTTKWIVDLAADFRLRDAALYPTWYGEAHAAPELLDDFVYGLPELFRAELHGASAVAAPGCYPTTAALASAPLLESGLVENTASSSTPRAECRARVGHPSRPTRSAPSTRTSRPTGSSTIGTHRRSSNRSRVSQATTSRCCSRRTSRR